MTGLVGAVGGTAGDGVVLIIGVGPIVDGALGGTNGVDPARMGVAFTST